MIESVILSEARRSEAKACVVEGPLPHHML